MDGREIRDTVERQEGVVYTKAEARHHITLSLTSFGWTFDKKLFINFQQVVTVKSHDVHARFLVILSCKGDLQIHI